MVFVVFFTFRRGVLEESFLLIRRLNCEAEKETREIWSGFGAEQN